MDQLQATRAQDPAYILGHSSDELDRLISQGRFFGELTEQVLRAAGIAPGMRVLDVGCGSGDVSFLAARLVGPTGTVIGVDKSAEAIDLASQRAREAGLSHVHFVTADLTEFTIDTPVDALIGRFVLMYFADPAALLRRLNDLVVPGGIVAFQEMDMGGTTCDPHCDLVETSGRRIAQTFARAGIDPRTGLKSRRIFLDAGLPAPDIIQGARVVCGPDSPGYAYMAQTTRTLLPLMQRTGVATADEVDVDTLADRLRAEVVAKDAAVVPPPLIGAWTRKG